MKTVSEILHEFGLPPPPPGKTRYYTQCPKCSATRSKAHQKSACLGVSITDDGVKFGCNHCAWAGGKKFINGKDHARKVVIAEFPYHDESCNVLFVVERREHQKSNDGKPEKTIKQKRPDPDRPGKWIWNVSDVRVVPYRLPQLIEAVAAGHPVLIVEGEPKVDLLWSWNVAATCNAGGATKWKPEHSAFLRGADVVLVPDNDNAGWEHINIVGTSLVGIAKSVRVLVLPHARAKDDVVDWAKAGGTRELLDTLLDKAQAWKPPASASETKKQNEAGKEEAKTREDELLDALAKAKGLDYARRREAAAKELEVSVKAIDDEVKTRREDDQIAPLYGHWIVEPWLEPVEGDSLLRDIIRRVRRHVVMSEDNALTIALWLMMSWVHDEIATHSPILNINSAEPESGKSTTIGLLSFLMWKCIASVEATEAPLYRAIKRWQPSFAFDEFDSVLADDDKAALRSVINSGHTRGQGVLRCIGDDHTPEVFSTFAPKVIGMCGRKLPPATLSRCIFVELRRRRRDEPIEKFTHADDNELANLRRRLRRWSTDNEDALRDASPALPDELQNRRADNWRIQLAVADLAGFDWGDKARTAAIKIEGGADNRTTGARILTDARSIFYPKAADGDLLNEPPGRLDRISSADLVAQLASYADSPWAEYRGGKPITQAQLARLLQPFGISPQVIRMSGETTMRGYLRFQFEEAWERYL